MTSPLRDEIARFDASVPIERAFTPPASWYVMPEFLAHERDRVFRRTWQAVGRVDQVAKPGDYFAGCLLDDPYVVLRDQDGTLRAFHNVCRHHAAEVCSGEGSKSELVCPYHGWTYRLDGKLIKAPRLGQSEVFDRDTFGLKPLAVEAWGPLVFIFLGEDPPPLAPQVAELKSRLDAMGTGALRFAARRTYDMRCNWKVYVDNYLDGGYHVSVLHKALAGQLDLDTYVNEIHERFSIQAVRSPEKAPTEAGGDFAERMTLRFSALAPINDPSSLYRPIRKIVHRADPGATLVRGHHAVKDTELAPLRGWYPIEAFHFPLLQDAQKAGL